jgi:MFS family permease
VALVALGVIGIGNALLDVAGLTLLQRLVPDAVLGRVVGVLVGAATAAIGIGSIVTPAVISALGIRGALTVVGGSLALCALIAVPRLRRIDRSAGSAAPEAGLLRRIPMFASLSVAATEHLASRMKDVEVTAGTELIREGEPGDCFYLIADGDFDVTAGGRFVARLGPGDHFGEIALLREVERTATVTAATGGRVETVDRAGFVAAVFCHAASATSANESIDRRLAELRHVASEGG